MSAFTLLFVRCVTCKFTQCLVDPPNEPPMCPKCFSPMYAVRAESKNA